MRCPRLSELLKDPPSEKALAWIREMRGYAYQRYYLKSRLWRELIRRKVLERDDYHCTVCPKWAKHVHHLAYDEATMLGRDLTQLRSVCEEHHEDSHYGNPALERIPLTARFGRVIKKQRAKDARRAEFNSVGSQLWVTAKLSRGWWTCHLKWKFARKFAAVADGSNRFLYVSAGYELKLHRTGRSYHNKVSGARFAGKNGGPHCAIFSWSDFSPNDVSIKLRESVFPDWVAALKSLTSRYPFPVIIVEFQGGEIVARSGGYVEPPPPPEPPTKTLIEKWSDGESHTSFSEGEAGWEKYPFGETIIEHDGPMP